MRRQFVILACCLGATVSAHGQTIDNEPTAEVAVTPPEHLRAPDQTFLTYPEWYLVHSPAEYAAFLSTAEHPSQFPFFSHIGQFWQSYRSVSKEAARYPFNAGYHLMVMVIGASTTVEYGLKGSYEHTVGRLAEVTKSSPTVPEEVFAAQFAQAYVDFIRVEPWYKFDFWAQLVRLWTAIPLTGPDRIRRWERRFALTSELLVKEGYARLIKLGTQSIYDVPKPVTAVVLSRAPVEDAALYGDYHALPSTGGPPSDVLATIPRYDGFTVYSQWLASQGVDFKAIAGNRGEVLVSELVGASWTPGNVRVLFEQPILTRPGLRRVVFATPVASLAAELRRAPTLPGGVVVEHIYDF
jgi:hypothetical protein